MAKLPRNANEFIEQQLHERIGAIEEQQQSDAIAFCGGLVLGVDELFRDVVELRKTVSGSREKLTIILTTGGGILEVVQRMVETMRHHYKEVDFIIPNYAFSAGTVLALSGDAIYMDYFSRLGPIDPQVENKSGQLVPALGYLERYDQLIDKSAKGKITDAEVQILLDKFDQAELYHYEQARELSITLLRGWLAMYKFKNWTRTATRGKAVTQKDREDRAAKIAKELNRTAKWHVHGRGISMEVLRNDPDLKLVIDDFGAIPELNEKVRSYDMLLTDYMSKLGNRGVFHSGGDYRPFMT